MELRTLIVEKTDHAVYVWLNRPHCRNAMNQVLLEELTGVFESLRTDFEVRVAVLGGKGPSFCAGADKKDTPGLQRMMAPSGVSPRERRWLAHLGRRALDAIEQLDIITIARVHGHAIGGGLLLALACDFRIAAEGTTFFFPEVELGTPLDWRGVPRLIREIGLARAREIVMMSKRFASAEAERYGLLNQVVAPDQLDDTVGKWVATLAAKPDAAILLSKAQFRAYGATLTFGDSAEFEAELLLQTLGSETARAAFRSK